MGKEIELKYLVDKDKLRLPKESINIKQGYLNQENVSIDIEDNNLIKLICTNQQKSNIYLINIDETNIEINKLENLLKSNNFIIRIRTTNDKGYLTLKGENKGIEREEFEYSLNYEIAKEILDNFCSKYIEKDRYIINYKSKKWEVDVFKGLNDGLIVAELELKNTNEKVILPKWIDKNISLDFKYYNNNLIKNPFQNWNSEKVIINTINIGIGR